MATNTLTSLAMLKVNIDQSTDYLDYLRPFVLHVLVEDQPDPVTDHVVSQLLCQHFGLQIPERTVQIVLKRISRRYNLKREAGVYRITGDLPDPELGLKAAEAERHIRVACEGLRQFSMDSARTLLSYDEALAAMSAFLSQFDVTYLRAYLRGTAIPDIAEISQADIVLVSDYVQQMERIDPERFSSILTLVQGHMLANALLCPDLQNAPKSYKNVSFYLDTPLLIRILGLEGDVKQHAIQELITLLSKLGGKITAFFHSQEELRRVLLGAAKYLDSSEARGAIVFEARRRGTTKSDLLLLVELIERRLEEAGITTEATPHYVEKFQIDEEVFEGILDDEIPYYNPRAKDDDINSVRSIYVIRGQGPAVSLEKARAVLVTSNTAFAKAAWEYGKQFESSQEVSSVIADFPLANLAWLKAPIGAPSIPMTQLLAFSHAALNPPSAFWNKFLTEVDRLESQGTITELDHQLLRSSPLVYPELMHMTLGEDSALTTESITETLERITNEIRSREAVKLSAEEEAHRNTKRELEEARRKNDRIRENAFWKCQRQASTYATALSVLLAVLFVGELAATIIMLFYGSILAAAIAAPAILFCGVLTLSSRWYGLSIREIRGRITSWLFMRFLRRQARALSIDLSELEP